MSNISQFSTSAASNNGAPPNGFPEGQAPSTVNDCSRELMAAIARQFQDSNGTLVTGGAGNAYLLSSNNVNAALADQGLIVFRADRANTGPATLNIDSLGAKSIQAGGADLAADDITANSLFAIAYNGTNDTYDLLNAKVADPQIASLFFNGVTKRVEAITAGAVNLLSDGNTDAEARRLNFAHADGTVRAQLGYIGSSADFVFRNLIDSGTVAIGATNSGSVTREGVAIDPDAGVGIYYPADNEINLQTVSHDASDNSSGANVRGADGTLRGIGYNTLPRFTVSAAKTVSLADQGKSLYYNEATARTITFNNDATIPADAYGHIRVGPTAGVCTLDAGAGVSFIYWDGTEYITRTAAGNLALADGSYTWWKDDDTTYYIDGPSITEV